MRDALHRAAQADGCDFPRLGPHSSRRANSTWRRQVGGSAIEGSKIAGHSHLEMTGEYTFVAPERPNELRRRIPKKVARRRATCDPGSPPAPSPRRPSHPSFRPGPRVSCQRGRKKMAGVEPDVVQKHAVQISKRWYPVKQVLSVVTGVDSADFNTHQARNVLKRLGLEVVAKR